MGGEAKADAQCKPLMTTKLLVDKPTAGNPTPGMAYLTRAGKTNMQSARYQQTQKMQTKQHMFASGHAFELVLVTQWSISSHSSPSFCGVFFFFCTSIHE